MRWMAVVYLAVASGCVSRNGPMRTFDDPSQTIVVRAGETFAIRLPSNATTGYTWKIVEGGIDTGALRLVKEDYVRGGEAMGAGGHQEWALMAHTRGKTELIFDYLRPWEKVPAAQRKRFTINVW